MNSCSENDDNAYLPEVVRLDRKPKLGQEFESNAKDATFSVRIYSTKKDKKYKRNCRKEYACFEGLVRSRMS